MLTLNQLAQVCKRLNEAGVRYIVVGGFAILLHGYERITRDIDLIIDPSEENINKIKATLNDLLPEACSELAPDDVIKNVVVRMSGEELIVDLMQKIGDINYFNAKSFQEEVSGVMIPIATLDTMLELKKGIRERDKKDFLFLRGKKEFLEKQKK